MKTDPLSILFLCRKYYFLHKMSRVRFQAVRAIGRTCHVHWSGPEWEDWNPSFSAQKNIEMLYRGEKTPDMVLCYRPEEIEGIKEISYPVSVNRDEMFTDEIPAERTAKRLRDNKIDLVISHQKKQLDHPLFKSLLCEFTFIPYCVDTTIFCDYGKEKSIDLLLIGNLGGKRYPLRARLYRFLLNMRKDRRFSNYKIHVYPYPGYRLKEASTEAHVIDYAQTINASKICLTCSGKYRLKYAKYVEVPACRSLLMADMPGEDENILKSYLAEIATDISYDAFIERVLYYLENDTERERLTEAGHRIVHTDFTEQRYASDFEASVYKYFQKHGHRKISWD